MSATVRRDRRSFGHHVLLSGALSEEGVPGRILQAWRSGKFRLIISEPIFRELTQTLAEPYFRQRLTAQDTADLLTELKEYSITILLTASIKRIATHPEDDLILATAVSAQADYLVTGDKKLQAITQNQGVAVLSPRAFLESLQSEARG